MHDLHPEVLSEAIAKGVDFLERGVTEPAKWDRVMVYQFGEVIQPHLERIRALAEGELQKRQTPVPTSPLVQHSTTAPEVTTAPDRKLSRPILRLVVVVLVALGLAAVWMWMDQRRAAHTDGATSANLAPDGVRWSDFELDERSALQVLAEEGDADSQWALAWGYEHGIGVPQDYEEAVKWYRKAADQGNAVAQCGLGVCYYRGQGTPQDYTEATKWFRLAAENGNAGAQYYLGLCYLDGRGVAQNRDTAISWFHEAAEQGNSSAQYNLGVFYASDEGGPPNYAQAVRWYRKAAEQGEVHAHYEIAQMYDSGRGLPKDASEATKWYRKAAEGGLAVAQGALGWRYLTAEGVQKDYSQAFSLFSEAAKQNDQSGLLGLSLCYEFGHGVPINYVEAAKITRRVAEAGVAEEQNNLGLFYEQGRGVRQDFVEAYKWYNLSAAHLAPAIAGYFEKAGAETPSFRRARLAQLMTPAQIAEAQRLSADFVPKKLDADANENARPPMREAPFCGTAFFVSEDGYMLTSFHIIQKLSRVFVKTSKGSFPASVVKYDELNDVAVLKISGSHKSLRIATTHPPKLGQSVFYNWIPECDITRDCA